MAFLDDLGDLVKPITDKSREVATKAKELTETLQIKSQINTEKAMIEEAYQSIGRAYYENHAQCENPAYEDAYLVIDQCRGQIAELEQKLHILTGSRVCSHCGARVSREYGFCGKCGAPMDRSGAGTEGCAGQTASGAGMEGCAGQTASGAGMEGCAGQTASGAGTEGIGSRVSSDAGAEGTGSQIPSGAGTEGAGGQASSDAGTERFAGITCIEEDIFLKDEESGED